MGSMPAKLSAPSAEGAVQNVRFGNFEVMNNPEGRPLLLGKGTFGRTYQARHCYLDTIVALKIITERCVADAAVRQRFLTKARAVAKLSHPHIARLYDFGEMNGVLHCAMEYCGGGSLADHVAKKGPLPLRQTIEIAQQISGALKCAHTAGFIHRDLKPSNIMLTTPDGPPFAKLIDFGLVQPSVPGATGWFGDDWSVDGARFLGTPLFASPEQLREEPTDVRTDLFSLGMTLWFLMEGRAPESGSSAEIAASRLNRESYAARLPVTLPPPFRDVLGRLLEKDRKNRFATAADVFRALNACAAALGFRRAKDYTDPVAALEWEDAETPDKVALDSTKVEPTEIEEVNGPLTSHRVPGHSSAGFSERPGSSTVSPLATPPTAPVEHTPSAVRSWKPPTVSTPVPRPATSLGKRAKRNSLVAIGAEKTIQQVFDEDVQFSVFRPGTMSPGIWHAWLAFAYRGAGPDNPDPIEEVERQARAVLGSRFEEYSQATQESSAALPRESTITIVPNVPKLEFNPRQRDFVWHEPVHREEFRARASVDSIGNTLRGKVTVFLGALVIAEINVKVVVATRDESAFARPMTTDRAGVYRKIFASYSRRDAAIVDHFEKLVAVFGDRYLRDVRDIRAGEVWNERLQEMISEADLFQLFWSSNSMHSNYVRQEWEYALSLERPKFVCPTFWEDPLPSDEKQNLPPDNLRALHFQRLPAIAASSKEPVPAVSEAKVECKRAIEPPVPIPVSKPPAPEIAPQPAEARPKDVPPTPIRQEPAKTVKEPEKPAAVVSPKIAKTREEKKAVAKPPVSPPAVEEPVFVTPRVMPAPKVPVSPRRSADIEEEPQFWDARKLKVIGIGIAALLGISLSYVGVKLLTKHNFTRPGTALPQAAKSGNSSGSGAWYQKSANEGDAGVQNNLGVSYASGNGVEKDLTKAASLFQKAADRGDPNAQINLAILYENGTGVPKDLTKATELYKKAADQGNEQAKQALGRLEQATRN
jgi:serine/threonine protein kinase